MFLNIYKCLYKFVLGDINCWMLDKGAVIGYICLPDILLSNAYLWIGLEMFIVAKEFIEVKHGERWTNKNYF